MRNLANILAASIVMLADSASFPPPLVSFQYKSDDEGGDFTDALSVSSISGRDSDLDSSFIEDLAAKSFITPEMTTIQETTQSTAAATSEVLSSSFDGTDFDPELSNLELPDFDPNDTMMFSSVRFAPSPSFVYRYTPQGGGSPLLSSEAEVSEIFKRLWAVEDGPVKRVFDRGSLLGFFQESHPAYNAGKAGLIRDQGPTFCQENRNKMKIDLISAPMIGGQKIQGGQRKLHGMRLTACIPLSQRIKPSSPIPFFDASSGSTEGGSDMYVGVRIDAIVSKSTNTDALHSDLLFWSSESKFISEEDDDDQELLERQAMKSIDYHYWVTLNGQAADTGGSRLEASEVIPMSSSMKYESIHDLLKLANANMNRFSRTWRFRIIAGMVQGIVLDTRRRSGDDHGHGDGGDGHGGNGDGGSDLVFINHSASDTWIQYYENLYDYISDDSIPFMGPREFELMKSTSDSGITGRYILYSEKYFSIVLDQPSQITQAFLQSKILIPRSSLSSSSTLLFDPREHEGGIDMFIDRGYFTRLITKKDLIPPSDVFENPYNRLFQVAYRAKKFDTVNRIDGFILSPPEDSIGSVTDDDAANLDDGSSVDMVHDIGYFEIVLRKSEFHGIPISDSLAPMTAVISGRGGSSKSAAAGGRGKTKGSAVPSLHTSEGLPYSVFTLPHGDVESLKLDYYSILQAVLVEYRKTNEDDDYDCALMRSFSGIIESSGKKWLSVSNIRSSAEYLMCI